MFNTDKCIDISDYPATAVADAALRTRALGIGVQGLADVFMMLRLPFASDEARALNVSIFETLYYASLDASCDLAETNGPYPAWDGSPASRGVLQIDMWGVTPSSRYDFGRLRDRIRRHGLRNSMLTALMPTASTSKLLGNFESFEPYTRYTICYSSLGGAHIRSSSATFSSSARIPETIPWFVPSLSGTLYRAGFGPPTFGAVCCAAMVFLHLSLFGFSSCRRQVRWSMLLVSLTI